MNDKRDGKRWGGWLRWACIVVATLLLYPLSIGPAAAIVDHTSGHRKTVVNCGWLRRVYGPLLTLASQPTFGKPLTAYLNLCARRTYQPYAEYDERLGIVTSLFETPLDDHIIE